ncbi:MAG: hypothetical protein ACRC2R_23820 [Xenococcaceae cyanobacterium]
MLRSNRSVDILATLLISCFGIFSWTQLNEGHNLQLTKIKELSDRQKEILKPSLDSFTISDRLLSLDLRIPFQPAPPK